MKSWQYTKGLHELGNGLYAWLLPDGTWGYSNSGFITDAGESLMVDTLFDLKLTREMLDGLKRAVPAAAHIGTLVNTHSNGDHTFGNQLLAGSRIITSKACAQEMADRPPEELAHMMTNWRALGEAGEFLHETMGSRFDFSGIVYTAPTETFEGNLTLKVGAKEVRLVSVGPAHTRGDILAYVPADRTVFTGDILFNGGHPAVWAGPVANWIKACDLMLSWDVDVIVPGHGPITDKSAVRALKHYLEYVTIEASKRFAAGMDDVAATRDIAWDAFRDWTDIERIFINVNALYREYRKDPSPPDVPRLFGLMSGYHKELVAKGMHCEFCAAHRH
ncbi:MAG: MBL fold metallo-hydrolase [Burkholderiales bacterium]|nr:MBL fold metallo-hydrolase [Burkholderiales bacterium]